MQRGKEACNIEFDQKKIYKHDQNHDGNSNLIKNTLNIRGEAR